MVRGVVWRQDSLIVLLVELDDDPHGLRRDVVGWGGNTSCAEVRLDRQIHLIEVDVLVQLLCAGRDENSSTCVSGCGQIIIDTWGSWIWL